jgi:hypothetical protein
MWVLVFGRFTRVTARSFLVILQGETAPPTKQLAVAVVSAGFQGSALSDSDEGPCTWFAC